MATAQVASKRSPEALIKKGRECYAAHRYLPAVENFTRVAYACECNRGLKRERCKCKDYERVVKQRGSIFDEAMHNCQCSAGKSFSKCHREFHVQALDYRAATFAAMGELDRARRDAEWLLEIAPRRLEGYLRLGKIHRLLKQDGMAWNVLSAGVKVGVAERYGGTPRFQAIYDARRKLHARFCRKDPIEELPIELIEQIFSYSGLTELCRLQRVSKLWSRVLGSRPILWRNLQFPKTKSAPSANYLIKIVKRSGYDVRSLVITDIYSFQLNQRKLDILLHKPSTLQRLELRRFRMGEWMPKLPMDRARLNMNNITHLTLDCTGLQPAGNDDFLNSLLHRVKDNVEFLQLENTPPWIHEWPLMKRLKFLRLEGVVSPMGTPIHVYITNVFAVAKATPNLEQLSMRWYRFNDSTIVKDSTEFWSLWPKLQVALFGQNIWGTGVQEEFRVFPPLHVDSLRVFEFAEQTNERFLHLPLELLFAYNNDSDLQIPAAPWENRMELEQSWPRRHHHKLESFWMPWCAMEWFKLEELLRSALDGGNLTELGFTFPDHRYWFQRQDEAPRRYLENLKWLEGSESIRTLGLFNFDLTQSYEPVRIAPDNDRLVPAPEQNMLLVNFVKSFPNLEVVEVHTDKCEGLQMCVLLEAIIEEAGAKKIYQRYVTGTPLDSLRRRAEKKGIEMVYGTRQQQWPAPLSPFIPSPVQELEG